MDLELGRTRFVFQWWARDPSGNILTRSNPPIGKRCPNGNIWGHSIKDFFMVQRIPGVNFVTCYSRSMIQELNEGYIDPGREPDVPRVRRPYPLLKLDACIDRRDYPSIGFLDEGSGDDDAGSDHGDPVPISDAEDVVQGHNDNSMGCDKGGEAGQVNCNDANQSDDEDDDDDDDRRRHGSGYSGDGPPDVHQKLEEFIPREFLPTKLLVHDPRGLAFGRSWNDISNHSPWTYKRLYSDLSKEVKPDFDPRVSDDEDKIAHLYLNRGELVGVGHHSNVYRASLTLPKGLSARTPTGRVTVIAKTAFHHAGDRDLLHNEGQIYNEIPKHMSEEWCGLNIIPPLNSPVPVCPVTPKFYGYYVPTNNIGNGEDSLSPILLME